MQTRIVIINICLTRIVDSTDVQDNILQSLFWDKVAIIYLLQHQLIEGYNISQQKAVPIFRRHGREYRQTRKKRIRYSSNERFIENPVKASRMATSNATLIESTILGLMEAVAEKISSHSRTLLALRHYVFFPIGIIENYVA